MSNKIITWFTMRKFKKHLKKHLKHLKRPLLLGTNIGILLCFLVLSIAFCVKNDGNDKSITELNQDLLAYISVNYALAELFGINTEANSLLNQDIPTTKQYSVAEALPAKEVKVEKPIYVNNQWREFESPAVLMSWVKEHLANLWIVGDQVADCDDYASRLQYKAYKDGYLLSVQIIKDGMLDGKNVSNYQQSHMGNLAMIGNEIYFIEPQPKYFRIVFVCNRD
jgi:hypothetical protein